MIPLKKCNYITGDINSVSHSVSKIIKFLEDDGRNALLFCKPRSSSSKSTSLKYLVDNKFEFNSLEEFKSIILTDGNLFRVDLLIFDFWHLSLTYIIEYKTIIEKLGIDYIIIAREYHYKSTDDVTDYHVKSEIKDYRSEYWITDNISGWTSDIDSLTKSYIRDKKINQVIDKKDQ